ncbi:MAG: hypothetical protein LJE65_02680, partial [Desulfobacteraceae bacterium]|nr:hypothetical protein [Desulfobacteraceae bacterium]
NLGWEKQAAAELAEDPLALLCGPVLHGSLMTRLIRSFGVEPTGCIGYSLGESAGLFALGAWSDWQEMFRRMRDSDLFRSRLAGEFRAVRESWNLSESDPFRWRACVVNRSRDAVAQTISHRSDVRLLIVNTPEQCVIGGREAAVEAAVQDMDCESVALDGVLSVHCDAAHPVRDAYRDLHRLPTVAPPGIRFYSCAWAESYRPSTETAARSICDQAMDGFDFTKVVERAWADGFRIFVEMGPHASCTGMIRSILAGRNHLAVSLCRRGEPERNTVLRALGFLAAHGRGIELGRIYGDPARKGGTPAVHLSPRDAVVVRAGGAPLVVPPPPKGLDHRPASSPPQRQAVAGTDGSGGRPSDGEWESESPHQRPAAQADREPLAAMRKAMRENASAHQAFLAFSSSLADGYRTAVELQTALSRPPQGGIVPAGRSAKPIARDSASEARRTSERAVAFSREQCMAFAVGSVAEVLGDAFAVVDTYPVRVRLPDEPLMLVDRILSVEGRPLSLESGRVVTEHDVRADAWYLDGGRAPVCISVEAGQADLFLCAYLGIDHAVKGKRSYRLLDAAIRFHRGLPRPGETLRYEIEIEKFMRQGDTYLFFFHFEGFAGGDHLITMRDGCAGFFTAEEVRRSGGILFTENDRRPEAGRVPDGFRPPVPMQRERYEAPALEALRKGDLEEAFGSAFAGVVLPEAQRLPGGRMRLIDRVKVLDPAGGRFGIGRICAEADIHPDDWFLTCHFVDDMTMPGTLMYECCAHTLRVFLQRMGWISDCSDVHYEPRTGVETRLKCRGPVTPDTHCVLYDVEIKEIGFDPEPFVIADAVMSADGRRIVFFENMSMQLSGADRERLNSYWSGRKASSADKGIETAAAVFDREHILAFARGNPSEAFGAPYAPFDRDRVIARLPAPPYSFIDRVVHIEPEPWRLRPGGWITAEYDVPPDAWYLRADGSGVMPFAVLLEVALQPCGWLAAYLGSALRSEEDLKFRNLGGTGIIHRQVTPRGSTLATRCRLTKVSEAGEMIIEHFDFDVSRGNDTIYTGNTYFGFFTREALSRQVGLHDGGESPHERDGRGHPDGGKILDDHPPLTPEDPARQPEGGLVVPARAIRMIDRIESWSPEGGAHGLGFARGSKKVDPGEWFFSAHFHQDPVCPGSLGIESFLQLTRYAAGRRWRDRIATHRAEPLTGEAHEWQYRGQIVPTNRRIEVEATITEAVDSPVPVIRADGRLLVDDLAIYAMKSFGLRLVPIEKRS